MQSAGKALGVGKKWYDLRQDLRGGASIEREESAEIRSSTSAVGSLIDSCCAPTTRRETSGAGARRDSSIAEATVEDLFGVMARTFSDSVDSDRAKKSLKTTKATSAKRAREKEEDIVKSIEVVRLKR